MNVLPLAGRMHFAETDMCRVPDGVPVWLECVEGALWISQGVEPRDIVIEAGESIALEAPRDAIIGPLGGAATVVAELLDTYHVAA